MSANEIIDLTEQLLESISVGDWEKYRELCDPTLTCFEPEGCGHLIEGMDFHKFYFDQGGHMGSHNTTVTSPHVRMLGDNVAVISYVRLVQQADSGGESSTVRFEETRIWQKQDGKWQHVHFHRSAP